MSWGRGFCRWVASRLGGMRLRVGEPIKQAHHLPAEGSHLVRRETRAPGFDHKLHAVCYYQAAHHLQAASPPAPLGDIGRITLQKLPNPLQRQARRCPLFDLLQLFKLLCAIACGARFSLGTVDKALLNVVAHCADGEVHQCAEFVELIGSGHGLWIRVERRRNGREAVRFLVDKIIQYFNQYRCQYNMHPVAKLATNAGMPWRWCAWRFAGVLRVMIRCTFPRFGQEKYATALLPSLGVAGIFDPGFRCPCHFISR